MGRREPFMPLQTLQQPHCQPPSAAASCCITHCCTSPPCFATTSRQAFLGVYHLLGWAHQSTSAIGFSGALFGYQTLMWWQGAAGGLLPLLRASSACPCPHPPPHPPAHPPAAGWRIKSSAGSLFLVSAIIPNCRWVPC